MDEVTTYATPMDVLRQVLGIHINDSRDMTTATVRVESAIEAMKLYYNQFLEAVPTSTLESKILKAKRLGIRFIKAHPTGQYQETPDAIIIPEGLTTEGFEEELDEKIDYYNDRVFIDILKKHDLLK
jgi:hypothetical protein